MAARGLQGSAEYMGEHQMMGPTLKSQGDAVEEIARVFLNSPRCRVAVREETAFNGPRYLSLGEIQIFPVADDQGGGVRAAVQRGMFEWYTPKSSDALKELNDCLVPASTQDPRQKPQNDERLRGILDLFGSIAVRNGLKHPAFDPLTFQEMPFVRPTTVVCDTSGILQGALTFVSRYLSPVARIKVPAIVNMEIVNLADRFLKNRRARGNQLKPLPLMKDHFLSQVGQRVLLQLELHSNVEVERTLLLNDPLRAAFQHDTELKELNLSVAIRSYVDRLILETVRQHQVHATTGHRLMLLTSDQGLARMALTEGITPLYFRTVDADAFFGNHFSGTNLHPFSGPTHITSIPEVLWDLATMTGEVMLSVTQGPQRTLTIQSLGKQLKWTPHHSYEDLLWTEYSEPYRSNELVHAFAKGREIPPDIEVFEEPRSDVTERLKDQPRASDDISTKGTRHPLLHFNVGRLMRLIDDLDSRQELSNNDVIRSLGVKQSSLRDYRRFLESGNALVVESSRWKATPRLEQLAIAIRSNDIDLLRDEFMNLEIFRVLHDYLKKQEIGARLDLDEFGRSNRTFRTLAEITGIGAPVYGAGFYATVHRPTVDAFAQIGLRVYSGLKQEGDWIATGQWLEELIRSEGIHPEYARRQLLACSESRLLRRMTEGSTSETAYDKHTLRVVDTTSGVPSVRIDYLYRGDFLIPGKASSSLKLERIPK